MKLRKSSFDERKITLDYTLYCLEFTNGVHFGKGNLDSTEITFHVDTLFSALFQEALKLKKQETFLQRVSDGKIILSDCRSVYFRPANDCNL